MTKRTRPGFGLTLGMTVTWLTLLVLVPLAALVLRPWSLGFEGIWRSITDPRALAALRLSFGTAAGAAVIDSGLGVLIAWVLVRYRFPGRAVADAVVDLPFALPTAVAGVALTALLAPNGWLGAPLHAAGIDIAYAPPGIMVALVFVGLPFIVRVLQPVLMDMPRELEEAAATLGASAWQTWRRVLFPAMLPALLTGAGLAFARAVGEYGSVIFIAGNRPMVSEIAPLLIVTRLEQFDYAGASALALALLAGSFLVLGILGLVQRRLPA